ncbi:MAG: amidohydrolase family protein [Proteobacteria bacterium]|nr:amidohydrolase family protein [Pseudomonadota bacterium]
MTILRRAGPVGDCPLPITTTSTRAHAIIIITLAVFAWLGAPAVAQQPAQPAARVFIVDTHTHPARNARREGLTAAHLRDVLRAMDEYGVELTILLPPPFAPGMPGLYGHRDLAPLARGNPGRIAFVAGGESLNPLLQQSAPDAVSPAVLAKFQAEAEAIAQAGAAGFGEFALEHFSSGRGRHPYESARPDHPLLLALADIAARHAMPIDVHMEAVPADMPFPGRRQGGPNPANVRENISALQRLLRHNRAARIVWAHAGWDLSGERSVALMRGLLKDNPNLYMSVKIDEAGRPISAPLAGDKTLRPDWLALLRDFPDRFVIGSDQFFDDDDRERLAFARRFVDALPPDLARRIASDNARRLYRLAP